MRRQEASNQKFCLNACWHAAGLQARATAFPQRALFMSQRISLNDCGLLYAATRWLERMGGGGLSSCLPHHNTNTSGRSEGLKRMLFVETISLACRITTQRQWSL